jgi:hypothetical protein
MSKFLRNVLFADAIASGASAALVLGASGPVSQLTQLPQTHLIGAGLILIPFVLGVLAVATRKVLPRGGVKAIVAVNVAWVAASLILLAVTTPNALGYAFVIAQAVAVGVLAELQIVGLKKSREALA